MNRPPLTPRDRLRLAAIAVGALTLLIAGGTLMVTALDEAIKMGGWGILLWAGCVALGALAAEYLVIRRSRRRP